MLTRTLFFSIVFLLFACGDVIKNDPDLKPDSVGALDEMLVLMDKVHWEGELGDTLRKYYAHDYEVIPQVEPIFNVYHREISEFKDILIKYRNILVVGDLRGTTSTSKYIMDKLGEENKAAMLVGEKPFYFERKDVFAKPQTFRFITGSDKASVIETIGKSFDRIKQELDENEVSIQRERIFAFGSNKLITNKIRNQFSFDFMVPVDYVIAMDSAGFMWLRQDTRDITNNILIHEITYDPQTMSGGNFETLPIRLRNELGRRYVEGPSPQAFLSTELRIPYNQTELDFGNRYAIETRGLWKMENDYMGGPFVNYTIYDEPNNRIIMIDGFVYAPSKKKRKLMRNMEAILSTFSMDAPTT